jgi:hypothetical protein
MRVLGLAAALLSLGCGNRETLLPPPGNQLALGEWGGDNAGIIVSDSVAHVHIDCTLGNFKVPVTLDSERRFNVTGTYVLRAFPVQLGPELPAQFAGVIDGNELTFTVAVNDTVEKRVVALGPVKVYYHRPAAMRQCPICRLKHSQLEPRKTRRSADLDRRSTSSYATAFFF